MNTEPSIKLAWPVCQKSMKIKQKWYIQEAMTAAKNDVFNGL